MTNSLKTKAAIYHARWLAKLTPEKREELRAKSVKYLRTRWAQKTPDEKLAVSQAKRENAKQRNMPWLRYRYKTPYNKLVSRHRSRFRNLIGGNYWGKTSAMEFLGCSVDFFKAYLAVRFKPGMTWENMSEWEIDHITPISRFDLTNEHEVKKAFHFTNCQPLWKLENRRKFNRVIESQAELCL